MIDHDADLEALPRYSTVAEVAELFRVTARTIRSWRVSGIMHAVRTDPERGGRVLFPRSEIHRRVREMEAAAR